MRNWQVFRDGRSVLVVMRATAEEAIDQVRTIDPRFAAGEWTALPWTAADRDRDRLP